MRVLHEIAGCRDCPAEVGRADLEPCRPDYRLACVATMTARPAPETETTTMTTLTLTLTLPKLGQAVTLDGGVTIANVGTRYVNQYVVRRDGRYVGEAFNRADAVALVETGNVVR